MVRLQGWHDRDKKGNGIKERFVLQVFVFMP